jgi:hypothetical protein
VTGNQYFPAPTPTLATITETIDDLQVAEAAVLTRVKGAGGGAQREARGARRAAPAAAQLHPGTANLVAPFARLRSSYEWEYSTDGGKTWIAAPVTVQTKTTIAGLVPGATVQFKYRPVTRTGEGNWSEQVSLIVQ